jgi:glycosyltransferase involved in cell wall biosynthesis
VTEPAFTVVMAAHNTEATVAAAVRSVLAQTRADFELIVVDDGSTDGTAARVRTFLADPRVRLLERPHEGAAAARAAGIAAGTAPFVSMIDSDDLWLPRYLEEMAAALDADPGAAFAYTDAWFLDERSRRVRRVSAMGYQRPPEPPPATASELFAALLERNFIYNAVTLRRTAIATAGPPDARVRSGIDLEWWLRLAATGHRAVRVSGRLAVYRPRPASISRDPRLVVAGRRDLLRLLVAEYDLPEATRRELAARADRCDAELAALLGRRRVAGALWRLRRRAAEARTALLHRRDFLAEPPPEVRDAFGDLRRV